jgi:zinc transport system substrate-binding protein
MKGLSESKLYLRIGYIPFETAWMTNISANNPGLKIIDTSVGVDLIKGDEAEDEDREEAEAGEHSGHHHHGGIDPHIWLSPRAVKIQVKHILDALIEIDTANRESYEKNYRAFLRDIDNVDLEIHALLEKCTGKKFMVFHPAWTYFARDYGLEQIPIEIEGKSPSPADMKRIIDRAKQENLRVVFIQKQFDTHSAQAVADEIGGRVIPMDPVEEDWLENIRQTARAICAVN